MSQPGGGLPGAARGRGRDDNTSDLIAPGCLQPPGRLMLSVWRVLGWLKTYLQKP